MPRLTTRYGYPYEELGAHRSRPVARAPLGEAGIGSGLIWVLAIAAGVTAYWWSVEGQHKRGRRRR